ncbi:hypothetical protein [Paraburkholderia pallida]|uniref:Uncharacterized protein n=1 Tax=Paraburkholderia pallida TaxID=2547399 RepID=A0A4P7CVB8_9BURK|nr:hypothetical protein [Paraburkholderia pallida]QBQ97893.1 hypothetical protein E1956_12380 [Paraburkholderia pallida]
MLKLHKLKRWFTVDEVAKRLTITLGEPVEPTDVLRLMADRHLAVFWFLQDRYGMEVAPVTWIRQAGDPVYDLAAALHGDKAKLASKWYEEDVCSQSDYAQPLEGLYRIEDDFCGASADWITSLGTGQGGDKITLNGTLLIDVDGRLWRLLDRFDSKLLEKDGAARVAYNHHSNFYPATDRPWPDQIVVSRAELERFESQFADEDESTRAAGEQTLLTDRERFSYQKQIAVLALALAEKSNRYSKGGAPNSSQIAAAAAEILDALPEVNRHGTSSTSIRASIAAGIDLLTR